MNVKKRVIGELDKCYSLAMLEYNNERHFLAAAEKVNKCLLYDLEGNQEETVWEEPGGVMSMVQVPGTNGQFLATHKFYSPNDSKEARIVIVTPRGKDDWETRSLAEVPFVHRFDILQSGGVNYLIVCALKSGHEHKDDWSMPGKIYAAVLPENLSQFDVENQLELKVIQENMLKNHGYYRNIDADGESAVISCEQGVYQFFPPKERGGEWIKKQLIDVPASDAVLVDLDSCGERELFVMSPFHGDTVNIYKFSEGRYVKVFTYPHKLEFLHAIYGGEINGVPMVIIGHRKGERKLLAFYSDHAGGYDVQVLDKDTGAANVLHYKKGGKDVIIAANRELNEIAMYTFCNDSNEKQE